MPGIGWRTSLSWLRWDSWTYLLRRKVSRYRRHVLVGGLILVVLSGALVLVARSYHREQNRARADRLVASARGRIHNNSRPDLALAELNDALDLVNDHSEAYLLRGRLRAVEGRAARFEDKRAYLEDSINDFLAAHEAEGGHRAAGETERFPIPRPDGRGHSGALTLAANLLMLAGHYESCSAYLDAATTVAGAADALPNVEPFYERRLDPLIPSDISMIAVSPPEARQAPRRHATLHRILRAEVTCLDPTKQAVPWRVCDRTSLRRPLLQAPVHDRAESVARRPNIAGRGQTCMGHLAEA